mgnify:CR=1 FL=1
MFAKMANKGSVANDIDFKTFMPISVWPMNQTAGKSTNYHVNFPITQALDNGGKIILTFPSSFDMSNVALATDPSGNLFFFNQDMNGPGGTMTAGTTMNNEGKVQISNIEANNQSKNLTLTLSIDDGTGCTLDSNGVFEATCTDTNTTSTTMPYDFLEFELDGIINGDASQIDWANDTGGYQVSISTKNSTGKTLEGPIKSMKFDIKDAGNGSIAGKVTGPNGTGNVANAKVILDSPLAGHLETVTDANGLYSFSQLPVSESNNSWDGWYHLWIEAPRDNDAYFGGQGVELQLTSANPTSSGNNVSLNSAGVPVTVTITHTDDELDGKEVSLWASGPSGWKDTKVTLEADNSTDVIFNVSNGNWDFGVMPYVEHSAFGTGDIDQNFVPPRPVQKDITGATNLTISLASAGLTLSGEVTDGNSGLANVEVYAYDPSGNGFGGHTKTSTDGSYSLKIGPGTYTVGAFKPGLPSIPEQTIEAKTHKKGVDFTLIKSDRSISGTVTDGTNAIQYASVNAWTEDGRFASANTDAQGKYTLFIPPGTWNLDVFAPSYGSLEPASGVTVEDIVVGNAATITSKDFYVSEANYYLISGTVEDGSANGIPNVFINAEEVSFNGGSVGDFVGSGNSSQTDNNGNFAIRVKANTAGIGSSATRYALHAWSPDYGDLNPDSLNVLDVSTADSSSNDFTLSDKRTITVQIQNGDDLERGSVDIEEAFVDIHSLTADQGNHRRFKDIDLTAGDATIGTLKVSDATGFEARLHIPGIGEFSGTVSALSTFDISGDVTLIFDLDFTSGNVLTFSGKVTDGTSALEDAWVNIRNTDTDEFFGTATDASGDYTIKVPAGTYNLRVDKPGYKDDDQGNNGSLTGTATAGDTAKNITLGSQIVSAGFISDQPKLEPVTPNEGGVVDDEDNTGVTIRIPKNALGTGANPGQVKAKETSAIPRTDEAQVFGNIGKEITATDSDGQPITTLNNDVTIELFYAKDEFASIADINDVLDFNGLEELDKLNNAYWDDTTQTWVSIPTTKTFQVKDDTTDTWTNVDFDEFVQNVTGNGTDNTGNGGGEESEYYDDYKIKLASTVDHFTIFGAITGADGTPPGDPTGLSVTSAANGSVSLDWTDNAEGDLLEYLVFRGATDGFVCDDDSQINTSSVTASNYTDSTPTADTSYNYKYKLKAADTSGNESDCTSAVTAAYTYTAPVVSSGGGGGGGATIYKAASTPIGRSVPMPKNNSDRVLISADAIALSASEGLFTRPVIIKNIYHHHEISIPQGTQVTQASGETYKGYLLSPTNMSAAEIPAAPEGFEFVAGFNVGAHEKVDLNFSKPFEMSVRLPSKKLLSKNLKIFTYLPTEARYSLVGDGGVVDRAQGVLREEASHMSLFVVFETNGKDLEAFTETFHTAAPLQAEEGSVAGQIPEILELPVPAFKDIPTRHWSKPFVDTLRIRGVIQGKKDGIFDPNGSLSRAELTKVALKSFSFSESDMHSSAESIPFSDLRSREWYVAFVIAAADLGILEGYPDGTFKPDQPISRVEALKVILETSGVFSPTGQTESFVDVETASWYEKYVSFSTQYKLIEGFSGANFAPEKPITRAEMAKVIAKIWELMD